MKFNSILRSVALAAALVSTVPLLAKPFAKTINIAQSAKIGKSDLQAGEYRLLIDGNKATVQKGKTDHRRERRPLGRSRLEIFQ